MTRNLVVLTLVSLTQDAASELLYPLIPLLITVVLGAPPVVLGLIEGAAEAAAGFTKLLSGRLSDRYGRKPFVSSGYWLAAVGKTFVVTATSWNVVLLGRVTDRIGKGLRSSPRDALISDGVEKHDLGKAFGFHRAGDNLGAVIGPIFALIGLMIFDNDVKKVALFAIIPALLSGFLTFFVRESKVVVTEIVKHEKVPLSNSLKRTIVILTLIQLLNIPDVLILLRLSNIGFSAQHVVALYILYYLVATLAALPAGALADRMPPAFAYAVGLLAFAISYIALGLSQSHTLAIIVIALYGLFPAFTDGVGKSWIAKLSTQS
ncbi:MAG: MFS transporter, partial [Actinobacteria bacterium]|nr:MFS transporter [Actinomycetota bacterium]